MNLRSLNKKFTVLVLLFYIGFFILFASGRVASVDAGAQLQASILLANTGSLGTKDASLKETGLWLPNRDNVYYQVHDIGNVILMLPAAIFGSVLSKAPVTEKVHQPNLASKFGVAMTYACFSAVGCWFMFRLFALFYQLKTAFWLSLAFATTTFFWAYAKAAWDVMGACVGVCMLLYLSTRILTDKQVSLKIASLTGLTLALSASFRYSLAPFLCLSLALIYYYARSKINCKLVMASFASFTLGMIPTLIYNYLRMGSPFRPATTAPVYIKVGTADLNGNIFSGLYGLILSPNRGMLFFAPILLLILIFPWLWSRNSTAIGENLRKLSLAYGAGAIAYMLMISKLKMWGPFGWGPRYLLPILPIFFFMVGVVIVMLWKKYRTFLIGLICCSFLLNFAPILVNWDLVSSEFPKALEMNATLPRQQMAVWQGLLLGIQGKPLPAPPDLIEDPVRMAGRNFPDLWLARLMERSTVGLLIGSTILLALVSVLFLLFRQLTI